MSSVAVMTDPQASLYKVLRPFTNFESVYQGRAATQPIAFPGTLDPSAGQVGFAHRLLRGSPVPIGSRLRLWIPATVSNLNTASAGPQQQFYQYNIVWRMRNVGDYNASQQRVPYHNPKQSSGAPDSFDVASPQRWVIPAAMGTTMVTTTAPSGATTPLTVDVRNAQYVIRGGGTVEPILPNGLNGVFQQGVLNPAVDTGFAWDPIFNQFTLTAEGDEFILLARRVSIEAPESTTWDFTLGGDDYPFSNVFGSGNGVHAQFPDVGILYMTSTGG